MLGLTQLLLVALGGALGGVLRFWLSGVVAGRVGETFPWGTLAVNASGALTIGLLAPLFVSVGSAEVPPGNLWLALVVGILGSYTTVSSFSIQTLNMVRSGEWHRAFLNIAGSLALCLGAVVAGYGAGQWLFGEWH